MSKKLIAIASAAALALSALVASPALAVGTYDLSVEAGDASGNTGASSTTAFVHYSLEENELNVDTVLEIEISATNGRATDSFTVSTTGGVKVTDAIINDDGDALTTAAGSSSLSGKMVGGLTTFYVFTTSTTAGKVTFTSNDNSQVFWVRSYVGSAYNAVVEFPSSVTADDSADVFVKLTDVFGNAIDNAASADTTRGGDAVVDLGDVSGLNANLGPMLDISATGATVTDGVWRYNSTKKAWAGEVYDILDGSVFLRVDLDATDLEVGFAAPQKAAFKLLSAASLADQVTSLTAQVAALQVIVDRKVDRKSVV
jgi:hypothetical protein